MPTGQADSTGREDVLAFSDDGAMVRTGRYKYIRYTGGQGEVLFDMTGERPELKNLAASSEVPEVLNEMRRRMLDRMLLAGRSALAPFFAGWLNFLCGFTQHWGCGGISPISAPAAAR